MDSAVAVVSSQIDYCNCLLYSVPKWHIDKLQRIQNAAARLVMQSKNCHITSVLNQLHWLPVSFCFNFTFNIQSHSWFSTDVVKIMPLNLRYRLRSNDGILLSHLNFKTLTTLGDHAFFASEPKLWNDLPLKIRTAKSVKTFKKFLKTHLFSKTFYS